MKPNEVRYIELLAPAKNLEIGKVAIDSGADAVYIGAPEFSARASAGNQVADIEQLCRYAHKYKAKVLVALNTLLSDDELPRAVKLAWQLYEIGVDALIVQDMRLLTADLPPIRLHASTQCDNRTIERVRELERVGFKRVVLARELGLKEIEEISQHTNIELEAFVHGALCVSYSGRCYISEQLVGRSANRGRCAQFCRMPYDLFDKDMQLIDRHKYALSLRDLDRSLYLKDLIRTGVTTLKIEGRLKDETYVRNIVAYYRQQIDNVLAEEEFVNYRRSSVGVSHFDFSPDVEKTFHRSQTDYFMLGRTADQANLITPKSTGELIGRVAKIERNALVVTANKELHNGDGVCFGDNGFNINRVEKIENEMWRIYPNRMPKLEVGTMLYRNFDVEFNSSLLRSRTNRKILVDISLKEIENGFSLTIGNQSADFSIEKQVANKPQDAEKNLKEQLSRLGDTMFEAKSVNISCTKPYFIPNSVLSQWRREVVQKLLEERENYEPKTCSVNYNANPLPVNHLWQEGEPLMTCKYCLLHELGMCRKNKSAQKRAYDREPQYIKTGNHLLRLKYDCINCQMLIYKV